MEMLKRLYGKVRQKTELFIKHTYVVTAIVHTALSVREFLVEQKSVYWKQLYSLHSISPRVMLFFLPKVKGNTEKDTF